MPKENGMGWSNATENKQRGFYDILFKVLIVVNKIATKNNWKIRFLYCDTTCGCGKYLIKDKVIDGSLDYVLKIAVLNYKRR